jgi:hypothetical protein
MKPIPLILTAVSALALASCSTTSFTSTWKAPDAGPLNYSGQKVAALVIHPDTAVRRAAEDTLAQEITSYGAQGIPAYGLIPENQTRSTSAAIASLRRAGVVGVVSMRVLGRENELRYIPGTYVPGAFWGGPYFGTFSSYYGRGWGGVYEPGYLTQDTIVTVATNIYDLRRDRLVWAGVSKTVNPSDVNTFVRSLAREAAAKLREEGLVRSGR